MHPLEKGTALRLKAEIAFLLESIQRSMPDVDDWKVPRDRESAATPERRSLSDAEFIRIWNDKDQQEGGIYMPINEHTKAAEKAAKEINISLNTRFDEAAHAVTYMLKNGCMAMLKARALGERGAFEKARRHFDMGKDAVADLANWKDEYIAAAKKIAEAHEFLAAEDALAQVRMK